MSEAEPPSHPEIREAVRRLCADFPGEYWQRLDRDRIYPAEFVRTLNEAGFLSILIPEQYGGSGLGLGAATAVLEEIHRSGCNGGACHAQKIGRASWRERGWNSVLISGVPGFLQKKKYNYYR